jgi:predicted AAA+ superfamily ATPase
MIERKEYLERLISWKDKNIIKVITGIRRCGKSSLLELFQGYLSANGVRNSQIVSINFEDMANTELQDKTALHKFVISKVKPKEKLYVFLDEIQNVENFEMVVDSLFLRKEIDLYITGSNAFFLSGELATLISGRYITIEMLPLSFAEFISVKDKNIPLQTLYRKYIEESSFPYITEISGKTKEIEEYLKGIFSTVVLKDIIKRNKFNDIMQLESVLNFIYDNIANLVSTKSIADTMTSNGRKIDVKTVEKYLSAFTSSFVAYSCGRYDIKGKQHLKTLEKYYAVDIGLRFALIGRKNYNSGACLENVIYLELIRRGYNVSVGKFNDLEIDFVATKQNELLYIQVAETVRGQATLQRELKPLNSINNHYPKILLTLDEEPQTDYNGIRKLNALEWLLDK